MKRPATTRCRSAYTLIEVLVVVLILGIISAVVVPQMLTAGTLGVQAAARLVVSDILFAQNEAIAAQETRKVIFDVAGNTYSVADGTNTALTIGWVNAKADNYIVDFDEDERFEGVKIRSVTVGGGATPATELVFDDLGSPTLSSEMQIVVGYKNQNLLVKVQPFTGRVTVD